LNCSSLLVPDGAPSLLELKGKTANYLNLSMGNVNLANENGIITHYNLTYTTPDFPSEPILTTVTGNKVHDQADIDVWEKMKNITVDCGYFQNNSLPISSKPLDYTLENLMPYTRYEINAYPCTQVGCGSVSLQMTFRTKAAPPKCSVNVTMNNSSSTSMLIDWKHMDILCLRGTLVNYHIMVYESEINPPVFDKNVTSTDESITVSDLKAFWNYTVVVHTLNQVGYGPPSQAVWAFTEEDSTSV